MRGSARLPLRALPRVFVSGADPTAPIPLPKEEIDKLRKVLRLSPGAQIAVLPNDGTIVRCEFGIAEAIPIEVERPDSEPALKHTLAQALPKGDKLDEIIRACTEIGVSSFVLFSSERTVVRWDDKKTAARMARLETIAREAAEVSFRTIVPTIRVMRDLKQVLSEIPDAVVLSEVEDLSRTLPRHENGEMTIVVGPEGGWAARELQLIGNRGITLGPRVLRVDHAGPAAAAMLLLG
jgi:16S rRNA (uracil1498-N3)-methyltransferase